jgi:hypothetical protein
VSIRLESIAFAMKVQFKLTRDLFISQEVDEEWGITSNDGEITVLKRGRREKRFCEYSAVVKTESDRFLPASVEIGH